MHTIIINSILVIICTYRQNMEGEEKEQCERHLICIFLEDRKTFYTIFSKLLNFDIFLKVIS